MGLIYLIRNIINDNKYVGETSKTLSARQEGHYKAAFYTKLDYYLYNAIRKYGWENFEWSILEDNILDADLCRVEAFYINKLNTLAPNGYNLRYFFDDKSIVSESTRIKMEKTKKGKKETDLQKQQRSINTKQQYLNGIRKKLNQKGEFNGNADKSKYFLINNDGRMFYGTRLEFSSTYKDLARSNTANLFKGLRDSYKNWYIIN